MVYSFQNHFSIILPFMPTSPRDLFLSESLINMLCIFPIYPIISTCSAYHIILDMTTPLILHKVYIRVYYEATYYVILSKLVTSSL